MTVIRTIEDAARLDAGDRLPVLATMAELAGDESAAIRSAIVDTILELRALPEPPSLREIGETLGVSAEAVRKMVAPTDA